MNWSLMAIALMCPDFWAEPCILSGECFVNQCIQSQCVGGYCRHRPYPDGDLCFDGGEIGTCDTCRCVVEE